MGIALRSYPFGGEHNAKKLRAQLLASVSIASVNIALAVRNSHLFSFVFGVLSARNFFLFVHSISITDRTYKTIPIAIFYSLAYVEIKLHHAKERYL